jgi:hypothetical protein
MADCEMNLTCPKCMHGMLSRLPVECIPFSKLIQSSLFLSLFGHPCLFMYSVFMVFLISDKAATVCIYIFIKFVLCLQAVQFLRI